MRLGSHVASPIRVFLMLLAPLPALVVGVLVMRRSGVNPAIWGQQVAAGLALTTLCVGLRIALRTSARSRPWAWAIAGSAALLLLASTLIHPGVEGVRRWISLGPLQLHAAFVALPVLIIVLGGIVRRDVFRSATWILPCALAIAAGVLVLQPDASQATAFAVAVTVVLLQRTPAYRSDRVAVGMVIGCAMLAWSRPEALDAVPHVEGIVGLAASAGAAWMISAVLALVLLPIPFIADAASRRGQGRESLALAAYFGIVCIASLLAPYPVPLLGYGLSPILGYFTALTWIILRDGPAKVEADSPTEAHRPHAA